MTPTLEDLEAQRSAWMQKAFVAAMEYEDEDKESAVQEVRLITEQIQEGKYRNESL